MARSSGHDNAGPFTPVGRVEPPNSPEQLLRVTRRGNNYLSRHCYQHIRETDAELRAGCHRDGPRRQIWAAASGPVLPATGLVTSGTGLLPRASSLARWVTAANA